MTADAGPQRGEKSNYGFALLMALGGAVWGAIAGFVLGWLLQLVLHAAGVTPSYANGTDWPPLIVGLIGIGVGLTVGWMGALGYHR